MIMKLCSFYIRLNDGFNLKDREAREVEEIILDSYFLMPLSGTFILILFCTSMCRKHNRKTSHWKIQAAISMVSYVAHINCCCTMISCHSLLVQLLWLSQLSSSLPPPAPSVLADLNSPAGQGYCQSGFSAEFTKVSFLPSWVWGKVWTMHIRLGHLRGKCQIH